MFFSSSLDQTIRVNAKKIKELGIQLELLSKSIEQLYEAEGLDPQAIQEYFSSPENFSADEWECLQVLKAQHKQKLQAIADQAVNANETKKKYAERAVDPRWLFVR